MNLEQKRQIFEKNFDRWAAALAKGRLYAFGVSIRTTYNTFLPGRTPLPFKAILDNDPAKWNTRFEGRPVISPEGLDRLDGPILVTPAINEEIKAQLRRSGLEEGVDFLSYYDFLYLYHWHFGKVFLNFLQVALTSRCSLRCRECYMLMPHYQRPEHVPLEELLDDLETLLGLVDHLQGLSLIGGEPLLHPQLSAYLEKLPAGRDPIDRVTIITNGTIIPEQEIFDICRAKNIWFNISDYSEARPPGYREKMERLRELLRLNKINHLVLKYDWHRILDRDQLLKQLTPSQMSAHFQRCPSPRVCAGLNNGRLYPCHIIWSANRCGLSPENSPDSLDLRRLNPHRPEDRFSLLSFSSGDYPEDCLSFCRQCLGFDLQYQQKVSPAEQLA